MQPLDRLVALLILPDGLQDRRGKALPLRCPLGPMVLLTPLRCPLGPLVLLLPLRSPLRPLVLLLRWRHLLGRLQEPLPLELVPLELLLDLLQL